MNADISYVTFSKASEAALAIEEMNGKCLNDNPRPLKVVIYLCISHQCPLLLCIVHAVSTSSHCVVGAIVFQSVGGPTHFLMSRRGGLKSKLSGLV